MWPFGNKQDTEAAAMQPPVEMEEQQHPALKGFSKVREMVRHGLRKTFGGAFKGAVIGAVALPVMAGLAVVMASASIPFGTLILGALGIGAEATTGLVSGAAIGLAVKGAIAGAGIGGAVGAVQGIEGAEDAAGQKSEELIAKYTRKQQLGANQEMMRIYNERLAASRQQQQAAAGVMSTTGLPLGSPPLHEQGVGPRR